MTGTSNGAARSLFPTVKSCINNPQLLPHWWCPCQVVFLGRIRQRLMFRSHYVTICSALHSNAAQSDVSAVQTHSFSAVLLWNLIKHVIFLSRSLGGGKKLQILPFFAQNEWCLHSLPSIAVLFKHSAIYCCFRTVLGACLSCYFNVFFLQMAKCFTLLMLEISNIWFFSLTLLYKKFKLKTPYKAVVSFNHLILLWN